jgi:hypothetical protein
MSRRGRRPTPPQDRAVKLTVTIPNRLREELHDAAVADTRSISNFLTLLINQALAARRATQPLPTHTTPPEAF